MRYKKVLFIFLVLMLSAFIIGCSSEEVGNEMDETDEAEETEETGESNENNESDSNTESTEGETEASGQLDIALNLTLPQLDPHMTTDIGVRDVSLHIYEQLLTLDGDMSIVPMLAESYEESEDGKTITFNLRQGVKFHNGKEMKAEDVVASLNRWQKMSTQAKNYLSDVTFEEVDEYTVVANVPNPSIMVVAVIANNNQFSAIMPKEVVEAVGEERVEEVIGTGPYKMEEFRQDQYVHLTKYEEYQARDEEPSGLSGNKKAQVRDLYFHIVPDTSTRIAGIQSGEYDVATAIPHDNVAQLESADNVDIQVTTTPWDDIVINKKGILGDLKLRQAINAGIDKEALLMAAYGSDDYYRLNHSLVPDEQTDWLSDAGKDIYETYDVELAKQLLEEAGYNGEEITLLSTQERKYLYDMSVVAQEQLRNIGMNVELVNTDWATFISDLGDENKWDMYLGTLGFNPVIIESLFWNPNWYGWHDSQEMNDAVEKVLRAGTVDNAAQYTDELHQVFYDYLTVIKIGDGSQLIATNSNLDGFIYYATSGVYWNITKDE